MSRHDGVVSGSCGEIVTWNIRDAYVNREKLRAALDAAGLQDIHVKETEAATALRRAINQAVDDGMIRKIGEDEKRVSFAIVTEEASLGTMQWKGKQREAVVLDKTTNELAFTGVSKEAREVRERFEHLSGVLLAAEVGGIVVRVMREINAISLRDTGGVYFVPAAGKERLDAVEGAITSSMNSGGQFNMTRLRVVAGERESQDLATLLRSQVVSDVEGIVGEAKALLTDLAAVRPSTFSNRVDTLRGLYKRLTSYEALLGITFDHERARIKKVAARIKEVTARCVAARAAARGKTRA